MRTAFGSALNASDAAAYTTYFEFLNVQRFNDQRSWEITQNYLKEKYRDKQVGLIVVLGAISSQIHIDIPLGSLAIRPNCL